MRMKDVSVQETPHVPELNCVSVALFAKVTGQPVGVAAELLEGAELLLTGALLELLMACEELEGLELLDNTVDELESELLEGVVPEELEPIDELERVSLLEELSIATSEELDEPSLAELSPTGALDEELAEALLLVAPGL